MHAVIFEVEMSDAYQSQGADDLTNLVTICKQLPGFVRGTWTTSGNRGLSLIVFESEAAARALADNAKSPPPVKTLRTDVYEVAAEA